MPKPGPPTDGRARGRGVVCDEADEGFSGLATRRGVAVDFEGEAGGPRETRRFVASWAAVTPRYFDAREPAVILEAIGVAGDGAAA